MGATGSGFSIFRLFGRGEQAPPEVEDTEEEIGSSGAHATGGYLFSTERNPKARGLKKWQTYSDLLANVAIVAAGTRAFLNLVAKARWTLVAAKTDNEADAARAQDVLELVDRVINDLQRPWSRVVRRSATYRFHGFSIQEWTAKQNDDGTVGLLDIAPRPQATIERWALDDAGNVLGMTQRLPKSQTEVFLPRGKVIHLVDDSLSDSPQGVGLFRHLIESNHRLERYLQLEAIGFDTDMRGIPVGRAPYGKLAARVASGEITEAQKQAILQPLEDTIRNHIRGLENGLALDSQPYRGEGENQVPSSTMEWDISLITGSPTTAADVAKAIQRITWEMAMVLGVQSLLLGAEGAGSLALGRSFADQFALLVDSALGELAGGYEHDLIPVILDLNGIDQALAPTFETEQVTHLDIEQITSSLRDLSDAGFDIGEDEILNTVLSLIGLPLVDLEKRAENASLITDPAPEPPPGPQPPAPAPAPPPVEEDE